MGLETERINELKLLIKEAEKSIELKKSSLNETDKDLSSKREEIESIEKRVLKFQTSKIFTKKELENLKNKKLKEEKEKLEYEKLNIISQTKEVFEEAKKIRLEASDKSDDEQLSANKLASEMELSALKREVYILNCILKEKNCKFEDVLAKEICKKMELKEMSSFNDINEKKEKASQLKREIKNLKTSMEKLQNELNDTTLKLRKSICKLNEYDFI